MEKQGFSRPISLRRIQVTDGFWKSKMELVRTEVIPYQWEALNDRVEEAAPSYCMRNYKLAGKLTRDRKKPDYKEMIYPTNLIETLPGGAGKMEERFYGFVFQDSDFAKWIEAVGYSLTQFPDPELEKIADAAIDIVCAAQQENGYLNTYYIINDMGKTFTNLRDNHELYCFGHLAEGAVAYYEATGKRKLLEAVERYADYIESIFGGEEGKCKGYPGHEIVEMALVRLYEVSGEDKYLGLCKFFVDERGKQPYYFDREHDVTDESKGRNLRYHYHQAHLPVREQTEAVGHAVRGVYLYSGMADLARLLGDQELYEACETLWDNMVNKKMYITGGIGGTHIGEAFSFEYDLPNDTAYAETCASIGLVFFARRMLEIKADSKYANIMELALYNGILSGMALDGKSFFYVNPLEVLPEGCHKDERKAHVKPVRQKWFGCACCPPNIARLVSSIGSYAYTESEEVLYVHLYIGGIVRKKVQEKEIEFRIESGFPWDGKVRVTSKLVGEVKCTVAFRIPDWCQDFKYSDSKSELVKKDGYLYVTKAWQDGDCFELEFPMEVRLVKANPLVREVVGKVAVMRGPVVYCMEEFDNGKNLHLLQLLGDCDLNEYNIEEELTRVKGEEMVLVRTAGKRENVLETESLYNRYGNRDFEKVQINWIPYYAWANRGEGEMQVWIRE